MRKVAAFLADTHGGHKLGLLNPATALPDEDEQGNVVYYQPALTATQRYLWPCFKEDVNSVVSLAAGAPIVVCHGGDLTHGKKYPQGLVSTRDADQFLIAAANMQPWMALPNLAAVRLYQGTGSHAFYEGTAAITVLNLLKAAYPKTDLGAARHGLIAIAGVTFDVAHHGPHPGSRKWLEGNVARFYLKDLMLTEILHGNQPARYVIRAHYHTLIWETVRIKQDGRWYESDLIILPSYSGLTEHGQQATRSKHLINNGLVAFEIEDGRAVVHPFCRTTDLRTREEL